MRSILQPVRVSIRQRPRIFSDPSLPIRTDHLEAERQQHEREDERFATRLARKETHADCLRMIVRASSR